jgi:hypothetical protein
MAAANVIANIVQRTISTAATTAAARSGAFPPEMCSQAWQLSEFGQLEHALADICHAALAN